MLDRFRKGGTGRNTPEAASAAGTTTKKESIVIEKGFVKTNKHHDVWLVTIPNIPCAAAADPAAGKGSTYRDDIKSRESSIMSESKFSKTRTTTHTSFFHRETHQAPCRSVQHTMKERIHLRRTTSKYTGSVSGRRKTATAVQHQEDDVSYRFR
jgi:hypothetical protein